MVEVSSNDPVVCRIESPFENVSDLRLDFGWCELVSGLYPSSVCLRRVRVELTDRSNSDGMSNDSGSRPRRRCFILEGRCRSVGRRLSPSPYQEAGQYQKLIRHHCGRNVPLA